LNIGPDISGWYRNWFDEDYLTLYADRDETEARHFVQTIWSRLGLNPGVRIADLPCGPGRHSKAFAEHGARVAGLDISSVMVEHAARLVTELNPQPRFLKGDLRALPFTSEFDLVVNLFTSFGYFENETDNEQVFSELARMLVPGGILLIDIVNPIWLTEHFIPDNVIRTSTLEAVTHKELVDNGRRITKLIHLTRNGETRDVMETVRLYHTEDLALLTERHGLTPFDLWGDYDGTPYSSNTPRLVFLARKQ
jgi:SAM-dependent methyltransferase